MQTWTVVRFLHIAGITFFVGGQLLLLVAVTPVLRRSENEQTMRSIARRFGIGSAAALGLIIGTGVAMASHLQLWSSDTLKLKLLVLVLVFVLTGLHVVSPRTRVLSYGIVATSLVVLWLGVKLTYG